LAATTTSVTALATTPSTAARATTPSEADEAPTRSTTTPEIVADTAYADSEDTLVDCKDVYDDPKTPQG
jgi:hypothetical protein